MYSSADRVRAHRFALRRVRAAVLSGCPDADLGPNRRGASGVVASAVTGALSLAVVAVLALISPAAADWRRIDAVIVERETGARYVYLDGMLHAVANYASARLIVGVPGPPTILVGRRDLVGASRGAPLGIIGAPDSLPPAGDLDAEPWWVCGGPAGTVVVVGARPAGSPLGAAAVLARVESGDEYLIWRGTRLRIGHAAIVLTALGLLGSVPVAVAYASIAALPTGPDLDVLRIGGRGGRSPVAGLPVGAVVTPGSEAGIPTYALVTRDGLAAVTALEAAILINDPATPGPGAAIPIAKPAFAAARHPDVAGVAGWPAGLGAGWPPVVPDIRPSGPVCAGYGDRGVIADVLTDVELPPGAGGAGSGGAGSAAGRALVVVGAGRAVLVRTGDSVCLLTDGGLCFPVADADSLASLGYRGAPAVTRPAAVVALLPRGPTLSRAAALDDLPGMPDVIHSSRSSLASHARTSIPSSRRGTTPATSEVATPEVR